MPKYRNFSNIEVREKFNTYPKPFKNKLLYLRELIFRTAATLESVGELEETLKWGEPSYLTGKTKSGSTIRMDWKAKHPNEYALYFNCKTTLIDSFKERYGNLFRYGGNRSLIFQKEDIIPEQALCDCIAMALMYHLK